MRMLGMPLSVYQDHFIPNIRTKVKARTEPLATSTMVFVEMKIARELKMTYEDYRKLPRKERLMQLFFDVLSSEKEKYSYDESRRKSEQESRSHQQSSGSQQSRFR